MPKQTPRPTPILRVRLDLPEAEGEQLRELAWQRRISLASLARSVMLDYLRANPPKPASHPSNQ